MSNPCSGMCAHNLTRGYCLSCGRTLDEWASWDKLSPEQKRQAIREAKERLNNDANR